MSSKITKTMTRILHTAAGFLTAIYLAIFLILMVGKLESPEWTFTEGLCCLFVGIMFIGYLLAFKKTMLGSVIGLAATIAFCIAIGSPGPFIVILPIPGILFLAAALVDQNTPDKEDSPGTAMDKQEV